MCFSPRVTEQLMESRVSHQIDAPSFETGFFCMIYTVYVQATCCDSVSAVHSGEVFQIVKPSDGKRQTVEK